MSIFPRMLGNVATFPSLNLIILFDLMWWCWDEMQALCVLGECSTTKLYYSLKCLQGFKQDLAHWSFRLLPWRTQLSTPP